MSAMNYEQTMQGLLEQIRGARQMMADANLKDNFRLEIQATGYALHGDVKVEWSLYYDSEWTHARDLEPLIRETIRRHGFKSVNGARLLSYSGDVEIPPAPAPQPADDLEPF